jgi:hypothetical protein
MSTAEAVLYAAWLIALVAFIIWLPVTSVILFMIGAVVVTGCVLAMVHARKALNEVRVPAEAGD